MAAIAASGRYDIALKELETNQSMYSPNSRLLWLLDRGAIALALGDDAGAMTYLDEAESIMDIEHGPNAGDVALQWLVNDASARYCGEPYEDIYANVLKLVAQLQAGRIAGGATVEARRAAGKANLLRDRYLKSYSAVQSKGGPNFSQTLGMGHLIDSTSGGQFIESPLGVFLTAVTFMKSGDTEDQGVAGRRLEEVIKAQGPIIGPVKAEDFAGLGERPASSANVAVVAFSGLAPTMHPWRIGPIPIFSWPVYFELPVMQVTPSQVASARFVAEPAGGGTPVVVPLPLVEDLARVAEENHKRELPLIYARSLLRASLKSGVSFAATEAVRRNNPNNDAAAFGMVLAGMAALALTERADLRCWTFLPGQAHVGLVGLPPGEYRARVEYLAAGGGVVYTSGVSTVRAGENPQDLSTVVSYYWR